MTKEQITKLKTDPLKYELYLQRKREERRLYKQRRRKDPVKNAKDLANLRKKRKLKRKLVIERRKQSPYYQANSYERAKHHIFKLIANRTNQRCNKGKIRAKDLWCMAKKQALCCPISGEKLTRENISLDHIIPIANGGTNALSNLRLVTLKVNTAKHTMSDAEFFSFCQNIVNRNVVS